MNIYTLNKVEFLDKRRILEKKMYIDEYIYKWFAVNIFITLKMCTTCLCPSNTLDI